MDWRRYDVDVPYEPIHLPTNIEEQCLALLSVLGLQHGAMDMIVTPDGRYVFLEINPARQWLWIQERTGLQIGEAIIDSLLRNEV